MASEFTSVCLYRWLWMLHSYNRYRYHCECSLRHTVSQTDRQTSSWSLSTWSTYSSCILSKLHRPHHRRDKDQLPIIKHSASWHQLSGTLCLQLQKVLLPSPLSRHNWKLNCSLLHTTWSNISSTAGASDSNSQHTVPPINVYDIWHLAHVSASIGCVCQSGSSTRSLCYIQSPARVYATVPGTSGSGRRSARSMDTAHCQLW